MVTINWFQLDSIKQACRFHVAMFFILGDMTESDVQTNRQTSISTYLKELLRRNVNIPTIKYEKVVPYKIHHSLLKHFILLGYKEETKCQNDL